MLRLGKRLCGKVEAEVPGMDEDILGNAQGHKGSGLSRSRALLGNRGPCPESFC